jgi:hypothetical protein
MLMGWNPCGVYAAGGTKRICGMDNRLELGEHEANAHLIAAAPEMAEVLEWYAEQARLARLIHSEGDAGRHALADDGGKRARAALAKARGETP